MRKVFLDDLPRWGEHGKAKKGTINWRQSVGCKVKFIYDDIKGEIEIVNYASKHISIKYKECVVKTKTDSLLRGKIGQALHYAGDIKIGGQKAIEYVNDITTTNPELVKYFQGGYNEAKLYTYQSNVAIKLVCPDCGRISHKKIKICNLYNQGFNCICQDNFSSGHKFMYNLLSQLKVKFNSNVRFDWCVFEDCYKNKRFGEYDFVLKEYKTIIEVDGDFHRIDNKMNGRTKEYSKIIDDIKDKLAIKNGYEIIRINYYDEKKEQFKDNIQNSILSQKFNLDYINWNECLEFSLSNISKKVADYWNNKKPYETTKDLSDVFGICRHTLIQYLKCWAEIGYCDYDAETESKRKYLKVAKANIERCCKPIKVYKDGVFIGQFSSLSDLERESLKKLSCKLQTSNISRVLKGERPHHKGYTFQYIE